MYVPGRNYEEAQIEISGVNNHQVPVQMVSDIEDQDNQISNRQPPHND